MNCPNCGSKTYVVDTRYIDRYGGSLRRRRICYHCKQRFTTYEVTSDYLKKCEKARSILMSVKAYNDINGNYEIDYGGWDE